jgi:hypothetical protein
MELFSKRKVLFLILALCIVFSLVFTELVIAEDLDHDCIGDGCPFCLLIETAHNFTKNLKLGVLTIFLAACPVFILQTFYKSSEFTISFQSPIVLKVRFNS